MISLTTRDLENQKVGIVTIFHPDPLSHGTDSYDIISKNLLVMKESFPVNTKALHYCYTNKLMQPLVTAQRVHFLSKNQRCHFREHLSKNHDEICFRLETYGIIIDKEIFLPNGRLGLGWYKEWFQFRAAIERQDELQFQQQQHQQHHNHNHNQHHKNKNIGTNMIFPRQYDVLFGRAKKNREHTGNLRCAHLVDSHQIEYEEASKLEKTIIADKIVRAILDSNGRFLKMDKQVICCKVRNSGRLVSASSSREGVSYLAALLCSCVLFLLLISSFNILSLLFSYVCAFRKDGLK